MGQVKPKILIGLCTMSQIHVFLAVRIMAWIAEAHDTGLYNLSVYPTINVQPVDNARNEIVREFFKSDCTHLLFIDSDTIPPQNTIIQLLAWDKEVVSILTPIIEHDEKRKNDSNGFYRKMNAVGFDDKPIEEKRGLVKVKLVGSSCILIKRSVFDKVKEPVYRFVFEDDKGKTVFVGEDINFCIKCLGAGVDVWVDSDMVASHEKSILW